MYYKRNGKPYVGPDATLQWARDHNKFENVVVKQEKVNHGLFWVSTVWLGLDHQFWKGPPLIFETMVFCRFPLSLRHCSELDMDRSSTEKQALSVHENMMRQFSDPLLILKHIPDHIQTQITEFKYRRNGGLKGLLKRGKEMRERHFSNVKPV